MKTRTELGSMSSSENRCCHAGRFHCRNKTPRGRSKCRRWLLSGIQAARPPCAHARLRLQHSPTLQTEMTGSGQLPRRRRRRLRRRDACRRPPERIAESRSQRALRRGSGQRRTQRTLLPPELPPGTEPRAGPVLGGWRRRWQRCVG